MKSEKKRQTICFFTPGGAVRNGLESKVPKTPEGRFEAVFWVGMKRVSLPKMGFDDNVIPASHLKELNNAGMILNVQTLRQPFKISMSVQAEVMTVKIN